MAASHHIPSPTHDPVASLIEVMNRYLDGIRRMGQFGRLLSARGNLEAFSSYLRRLDSPPQSVRELQESDFIEAVAGFGPLEHFRGSVYFAEEFAPAIGAFTQWAAREGEGDVTSAFERVWRMLDPEVGRTMGAFEELLWDVGVDHGNAITAAAGYFEVTGTGHNTMHVRPVTHAAAGAEETEELLVSVPRTVARKLEPADLLWLDLAEGTPHSIQAMGYVFSKYGRSYLMRRGWPACLITEIPTDVRARFEGKEHLADLSDLAKE